MHPRETNNIYYSMFASRQIPVLLLIVVIFVRNIKLEKRACGVSLICEMLHPWPLHAGGGSRCLLLA